MDKGALISECTHHRYFLWRTWDETKPVIMFIGLNPSRADHLINDPTITRCERFASSWGYGGLYFANLYSFRTPYPEELVKNLPAAIGPLCNEWLMYMIQNSAMQILAWGSWKFIDERAREVSAMITAPYCLGLNKDGQPKHPLYLKGSLTPKKFIL